MGAGAPLSARGSLQKYQRTSSPSEGLLVRARYLWRAAQCLIASSSRRMLEAVFRSESGDAPTSPAPGAPARLVDAPDDDDDAASPGTSSHAQLSSGPAIRARDRRRRGGKGGGGGGGSRRRGREMEEGGGDGGGGPQGRHGTGGRECAARRGESEEPKPNCRSAFLPAGRRTQKLLYPIRFLAVWKIAELQGALSQTIKLFGFPSLASCMYVCIYIYIFLSENNQLQKIIYSIFLSE